MILLVRTYGSSCYAASIFLLPSLRVKCRRLRRQAGPPQMSAEAAAIVLQVVHRGSSTSVELPTGVCPYTTLGLRFGIPHERTQLIRRGRRLPVAGSDGLWDALRAAAAAGDRLMVMGSADQLPSEPARVARASAGAVADAFIYARRELSFQACWRWLLATALSVVAFVSSFFRSMFVRQPIERRQERRPHGE